MRATGRPIKRSELTGTMITVIVKEALRVALHRRLLSFLLVFFLLCGCAGRPKKLLLREIPSSKRTNLIVLNFKNNTTGSRATQFQPWEFGLASMMITDLESMGQFNIMSREDVIDVSRRRGLPAPSMLTEKDAWEIGALVASYVLSGSFVEMNGELRIDARVFNIDRGTLWGETSVKGRTDNFFELQKKLILDVSRFLEVMLDETEVTMIAGNIETTSVHASLNNYAGEIAVLRAQEFKERGISKRADELMDTAKENFRTALRYDPKYERAKHNLATLSLGIPMTL